MLKLNQNFSKLQNSYLFATIAQKTEEFKNKNPQADVIPLGIGDVTRPLAKEVIKNLHSAVDEMSQESTFKGYPPYYGYDFLLYKISEYDFKRRGVQISSDEIFLSDGAKSDTGNIGDILDTDNVVAVCDPIYPVYIDTNVMAGRAGNVLPDGKWDRLVYMPCTKETGFLPELPKKPADMIYLCFPNNPTGMAIGRDDLKMWVDYARKNGSLILYDAAYEAFISEDLPHTIFEIDGAKECAIEFRSFSKTAGFTGVRCGYAVIPNELKFGGVQVNELWRRRQSTKFNGVSYITQKGAEAVYSENGQKEIRETIEYYRQNAKIIGDGLRKAGFEVWGGVNAPYIWLKTPDNLSSWDFFDLLLNKAQVVGTPGSGFGPSGEGYFRLTAFGNRKRTTEAVGRITDMF